MKERSKSAKLYFVLGRTHVSGANAGAGEVIEKEKFWSVLMTSSQARQTGEGASPIMTSASGWTCRRYRPN